MPRVALEEEPKDTSRCFSCANFVSGSFRYHFWRTFCCAVDAFDLGFARNEMFYDASIPATNVTARGTGEKYSADSCTRYEKATSEKHKATLAEVRKVIDA